MNDSERAMCSGICARLNTLDTLKWTSSSFFMFIIIATLTLSGRDIIQAKNHKPQIDAKKKEQKKVQDKEENQKEQKDKNQNYSVIFAITICILVIQFWTVTLFHFRRWIRYFEYCLDKLETAEPNPMTVRVFGGTIHDRLKKSFFIADLPLALVPVIMMVILMGMYFVAMFF